SVTGFGQGLEAHLHQFNRATAQNGLLAEQVGFGLFTEVGFDHATLGAAVGSSVGQSGVLGLAGLVLVHSDQGRHAAALEVLGTHGVARALGGDHDHVQVSAGHDLVVVHVEAVSKSQDSALLDVRGDVVVVHLGDVLV